MKTFLIVLGMALALVLISLSANNMKKEPYYRADRAVRAAGFEIINRNQNAFEFYYTCKFQDHPHLYRMRVQKNPPNVISQIEAVLP